MTNQPGEHGALGSNAPLARVPVPEGISLTVEEKDETILEVPAATSSATEDVDDDGDVVYLRDDLRR